MTYRMFLDDERFPPDDGNEWVIVRSSSEAQALVIARGIPSFIAFDHDLGGPDKATVFVHWLINYCLDNDLSLRDMDFYVHSQNPVGARDIRLLVQNFKDFR